jgi:hypothetical protein
MLMQLQNKLIKKKNKEKNGEVLDLIIRKEYKRLEGNLILFLVEGTSFSGKELLSDLLDVLIAKNLGIQQLSIRSAVGKTFEELIDRNI